MRADTSAPTGEKAARAGLDRLSLLWLAGLAFSALSRYGGLVYGLVQLHAMPFAGDIGRERVNFLTNHRTGRPPGPSRRRCGTCARSTFSGTALQRATFLRDKSTVPVDLGVFDPVARQGKPERNSLRPRTIGSGRDGDRNDRPRFCGSVFEAVHPNHDRSKSGGLGNHRLLYDLGPTTRLEIIPYPLDRLIRFIIGNLRI